jgi:hypothetical protein
MNDHTKITGIKKLIVFRCNSLNLLEVGELTPFRLVTLTPDVGAIVFSVYNVYY